MPFIRYIWLTSFIIIFDICPSSAMQAQESAAPSATVDRGAQDKAVSLAQLLNSYQEDHLLFALMAASPFSGERSAVDLAGTIKDISVEKRTKMKRDWFIFLMNRFTIEEIKQMRQWQLQSPQSQALVLKLIAQVAASDPELLGELMGLVPRR